MRFATTVADACIIGSSASSLVAVVPTPKTPPPRYNGHTRRTRALALVGQLRHCWDVIRVYREFLRQVEQAGGPGRIGMYPAEHYVLAKTMTKMCARARKLIADNPDVWDSSEAERDAQDCYQEQALTEPPKTEFPSWHVAALGAARELEAFDIFRARVLDEDTYDSVADADRRSREDSR